MPAIAEIASKAKELIQSAPNGRMLGTNLGIYLRQSGYDPNEHGKLGEFIRIHVPEVVRLAPSGGDWCYGIAADINAIPPT